ncbi:MAG: O-antigen ligase family protein [Flavobacteriaceae bacterium]
MISQAKKLKDNLITYTFLGLFFILAAFGSLLPIALGFLILFCILNKKVQLFFKLKSLGLFLIASIFLMSAISILYSIDPSYSLKKSIKLISFLLIPIAFILTNPNTILIEKAKTFFIYGCITLCLFSLSNLAYNYFVNYEISHWYNFVQTSMNREYMPEDAMFLNTALIFLLFGNYSNLLKYFSAILFLAVIILFGVRLGLFLNILIILIFIILNFKQFLSIKKILIFAASILVLFILTHQNSYTQDKLYDTLSKIGFNTKHKVSDIGQDYHKISLRSMMWGSSIDLIKEKPLFGYGAGVEKIQLEKQYEKRGYQIPAYNAHNQFLSTTIQFGLIGLIILLSIFYFLFKCAIIDKSQSTFLVTLIMLASMSTESYLEIQQGSFYFAIFASLLIIENKKNKVIEN